MGVGEEEYKSFLSNAVDESGVLEFAGWLVIIDCRLFLIPENYSDSYEYGEKVEISNSEIIFSVVERILPLGGGRSFIFHRAKISGVLVSLSPPVVKPLALSVEERHCGFVSVSLESDDMKKCKIKYDEFLKSCKSTDSNDWLDFL